MTAPTYKVAKPDPLDRYMHHIARAKARLAEIEAALDDHLNYHPDEIGWGHVTLAHDVAEGLDAVHALIYGEAE